MTKRIVNAVAVLGAAGMISGCSIEQPTAGCIVQDSSFALWQAKYIVNQADAAKTCGKLKGEQLGVWKYANPEAPESVKAANQASRLAIRPRGTASLTRYTYTYKEVDPSTGKEEEMSKTVDRVTPDKWDDATSLSTTLPEMPDAEGFCKATGFSEARIDASEVRHHVTNEQLKPAETASYTYKDVEVYSHPSAPGTQLRGMLTYSDGAGCTAEYEVWALWPSVACTPGSDDPAKTCGVGSGLNPDFDAVCDADLKACVPAKKPKSFKAM